MSDNKFLDDVNKKAAWHAWLTTMVDTCRQALERQKATGARGYVVVTVVGEKSGAWVEVYPGVRGQVVAYGHRARREGPGQVVEERLTQVKVCAQTFVNALARDGLVELEG